MEVTQCRLNPLPEPLSSYTSYYEVTQAGEEGVERGDGGARVYVRV